MWGSDVAIEVSDNSGWCRPTRVLKEPLPPGVFWLKANVLRDFNGRDEALLLIKPFPVTIDRALFSRLRQSSNSTKVVRATLTADADGHLRLERLGYLREEPRPPFTWK